IIITVTLEITIHNANSVQSNAQSFFFFQAEDGIRDFHVTGVETCALPISAASWPRRCWAGPPPRPDEQQCPGAGDGRCPGRRRTADRGVPAARSAPAAGPAVRERTAGPEYRACWWRAAPPPRRAPRLFCRPAAPPPPG